MILDIFYKDNLVHYSKINKKYSSKEWFEIKFFTDKYYIYSYNENNNEKFYLVDDNLSETLIWTYKKNEISQFSLIDQIIYYCINSDAMFNSYNLVTKEKAIISYDEYYKLAFNTNYYCEVDKFIHIKNLETNQEKKYEISKLFKNIALLENVYKKSNKLTIHSFRIFATYSFYDKIYYSILLSAGNAIIVQSDHNCENVKIVEYITGCDIEAYLKMYYLKKKECVPLEHYFNKDTTIFCNFENAKKHYIKCGL